MPVHINRLADAEYSQPDGHTVVSATRVQGGDSSPTEAVTAALSHYLPRATAELAPQPRETIYVVVSGELVIESEGEATTLRSFDSAHFTAGTQPMVFNRTQLPASMLVIRPTA
ncbi:cupin domain-containing protein [Mycolicibacterium moriokaense]|uniref:Cupin type-2 domain-containing protein n=1 Tax=Mycolicibacterium moriokaense TaxID=39691 RepID=A0A318H7K4_9MYCO|nr:cupin domain-containing protein [Mycolicibacterium moriokaense]PXX00387.1 hypothetical protein C8E89_13439 [Mycolicibacterium moriokaense]